MIRVETFDDARAAVLARVLDDAGVPRHIRYGNVALAELLGGDAAADYATSPETVVLALRDRRLDCPACRDGSGAHVEAGGADIERFTPGA